MSSARATSTKRRTATTGRKRPADPSGWVVALLQAGDSFYPTGSYAHSFGLEGLIQAGVVLDRATLRDYLLLSVLPTLRQVELPLAAHAWRALGTGDWASVGELSVLSSALKSAEEARTASDRIGRQRVELLVTLRTHPLATEFRRRAAAEGWPYAAPVAAALEGRVFGAPLPAVLAGVYYATIASLVSAAMKLLRLGQNAGQSLLTEMLAQSDTAIADAQAVPVAGIGWFNPWLDIAAARHAHADNRMFIS